MIEFKTKLVKWKNTQQIVIKMFFFFVSNGIHKVNWRRFLWAFSRKKWHRFTFILIESGQYWLRVYSIALQLHNCVVIFFSIGFLLLFIANSWFLNICFFFWSWKSIWKIVFDLCNYHRCRTVESKLKVKWVLAWKRMK